MSVDLLKPEAQLETTIDGLHIIANLVSSATRKLQEYADFQDFIMPKIDEYALNSPGSVFYNFPDASGFTAVICLTESHLSIHTWPEKGVVTLDLFLSNYMRNNRERTRELYAEIKTFFETTTVKEQFLMR